MAGMGKKHRTATADDPTAEERALDFGATRTDVLDDALDLGVVSASESSSGGIDHDERGHARWKWVTESTPGGETEETFDHLKALDNDALALDEEAQAPAPEPPSRTSGYNPYDVTPSRKPKRK
jgi:hypothetical protein